MNRGEIWHLTIGSTRGKAGAEQREVLILSNDALAVLPLRVVVPLVAWRDSYTAIPWMVRVPPVLTSGLTEVMAADALQVRSVNTGRLGARLGSLPDRITDLVAAAVNEVLR